MRNTLRSRKANQGFTLIELLIVIAIIGILAAVLIPNLLAARNRANETATQAWLRECVTSVEVNRDTVTQAFDTALTTCAASTGKTLPNAVGTDGTITYGADDSFTINGTESSNGTGFTFDGQNIVEAAAAG